MVNDPLMFIDSFKTNQEEKGNQKIFDSRLQKKSLKKYRLEDINAMLMYRINVLCEITLRDKKVEGIVCDLDEDNMTIKIDKTKFQIPIYDIIDINILKL